MKIMKLSLGKCPAFSLIEIMVGLIVMSVMVAAFAPVITKKIQNSSVALTQQDIMNTKSIKYKVFNYDPTQNGRNGCVVTGGYLQCPFEVPESVDKIGVVLVGGGGGGGGSIPATASSFDRSASNGNYSDIAINSLMKNVVIERLVGGGGGGGGGYWYYYHADAVQNPPSSQANCDTIAGSGKSYYTGANSCITSSNLSTSSVTGVSDISIHAAGTKYNATPGTKICWSGNTGFSSLHDTIGVAANYGAAQCNGSGWHCKGSTWGQTAAAFPVCTYDAANTICSKYGSGSYAGKWRLPKTSEIDYIRNNHPIYRYSLTRAGSAHWSVTAEQTACGEAHSVRNAKSVLCDPGAIDSVYFNHYWHKDTKCNKSSTSGIKEKESDDAMKNACLPSYVWATGGEYAKQHPYQNVYHYSEFKPAGSSTYTCWLHYPEGPYFYNKTYTAMSVLCAIDWFSTTAEVNTYKHSSGGGGASGGYLYNVSIPDSVISANVGGKIRIQSGGGGAAGSKSSSNGSAAGDGGAGGASYVKVYNSAGAVKWCVQVRGGGGGGKGTDSAAGSAGTTTGNYLINASGDCGSATSTSSFTSGSNGTAGVRKTNTENASSGTAGGAKYGSYGAGGAGGAAYSTSSDAGSAGSAGFAYIKWSEGYNGAPGGGGGGAGFIRVKDIPVTEGEKLYVRAGGGGAAGAGSGNGSNGGQSAFCKTSSCNSGFYYYANGGAGGKAGTKQTTSAAAAVGAAGAAGGMTKSSTPNPVIYQAGTNGTAGEFSSNYGRGGIGGHSGINKFFLAKDKNYYSTLSVGCGGYKALDDKNNTGYKCSNSSVINATFSGDIFANPGKVYRDDSLKFGTAGSGGGGGGVNNSTTGSSGTASAGQDGYVYLWWEEYD